MSVFDYGDDVIATVTFTNSSGTAIDPTAVYAQYKKPGGEVVFLTYGTDTALVRSTTGIYYVVIDANASGTWHVRFYSTGTGKAAVKDSFDVVPGEF